ncbi:MAG TPA: hypothetical protein DEA08_05995 [Planctomycetes bacterium]|nr:hypothetical protein [Planctomycetota bacterium]
MRGPCRARLAPGEAKAVTPLLGALKDAHVWLQLPGGERVAPWGETPKRNFDYRWVASKLRGVVQIGRIGFVGHTSEGFGYVAIGTLQGDPKLFAQLRAQVAELREAPGILIDLRGNAGGDERYAQAIASLLCDERHPYAKSRVRAGKSPLSLSAPRTRYIQPAPKDSYRKPIVCLTGPVCMSSGEGFVAMFRAMPHATLVGQPTRGASGNPKRIPLPNGVDVSFSTWINMAPDGEVLEGKGIAPDVVVEHEGEGDPTFSKALALLSEKVEAAQKAAEEAEAGKGKPQRKDQRH